MNFYHSDFACLTKGLQVITKGMPGFLTIEVPTVMESYLENIYLIDI